MEEAHYQYGFVSDHNLTIEQLEKYKVLIMPNVAAISDDHAQIIEEWIEQGGKLIATYQTSLFDEKGKARSNFAFNKAFGVSFTGEAVNTNKDFYQKIITRNEISKGFELTELLHNAGNTLMTDAAEEAVIVTGYLPQINNQPPENAYPKNWNSDHPIVVMHDHGKGQVVYFANEVAKLNYTVGHPDYHELLVNSINALLGKHEVLMTNAPSSVHIYLNRSTKDTSTYQLALVNTTSGSQRPLRDLVPVSTINIELPHNIKSYTPLVKYSDTEIIVEGNRITINNLNEFYSLKMKL